jgi:hypothetical protein
MYADAVEGCLDLCMGAEDIICDLFSFESDPMAEVKMCLFRTEGCEENLVPASNFTTYRVTSTGGDMILRIVLPFSGYFVWAILFFYIIIVWCVKRTRTFLGSLSRKMKHKKTQEDKLWDMYDDLPIFNHGLKTKEAVSSGVENVNFNPGPIPTFKLEI